MPRVHPAIKQFRAHASREFQFLVQDFGFKEERGPWRYNVFAVRFVNATTRVVVESINYGFNARVAFGSAGPPDQFQNCDLLDFVAIRCPGERPNAEELTHGQLSNTSEVIPALEARLRDEDSPIIRKEVEKALTSLRGGAESRGL